jgi:hypothetical protein
MNLGDPIIPGVSLAGIRINEDIEGAIRRIPGRYRIRRHDCFVSIDDGLLDIGFEKGGQIHYVTCNSRSGMKYMNKLWAGMTVRDVLNSTREQAAVLGCVVVDDIQGIGLPLPNEADDFERITDFLPLDHVFERMAVFRA